MSQVSGVVQQVLSRQTKIGQMYDIVVNGQKYGVGKFPPKANEGDYVTFTDSVNGNFHNVERGTLRVSEYKSQGPTTTSAVKTAVSSFDARQDVISRQAALNSAISWLTLLNNVGALPIAASKTKGAQQAALDTILHEYEVKFYESNTGQEYKSIAPNAKESPEEMGEDSHVDDTAWE